MSSSSGTRAPPLGSRNGAGPPERTKIITPEQAARLIFDGDTVAIGGFVGMAVPDALLVALADQFDQTGGPRDLTLVFAAGQGDGSAVG